MRTYVDTSVYGGVADIEFSRPSRRFLAEVLRGRFEVVISAVVHQEIAGAPQPVRDVYEQVLAIAPVIEVPDEALALRQAYLDAGIVGPRSRADALHVACASVLDCAMIVSWNFKHIVHFDKIEQYNEINVANGRPRIAIHAPSEVIDYEHPEETV
ncbi:MAG: type II toxin-antitoxin system VapC family toxin [Candidatus Hydrogenedentes bacterium]|nr:type II toxin-antitoxin system VapC family toxin [Candidatus Hydrogenedentota bacterium]